MLSCEEIARLASDSLDGELPLRRRMGMKLHLLMCKHCARYIRQLRRLRQIGRGYEARASEAEQDAPALDAARRERLERALAAHRSSTPDGSEL